MFKYKQAGVDIAKADRLTESISGLVDNIGGFAGLYDLCDENYLVASTDGVGTKILLAQEHAVALRQIITCYVRTDCVLRLVLIRIERTRSVADWRKLKILATSAQEVIEMLALAPHPEDGHYRET